MGRKVKGDDEYANWQDDGCDLHDHCLTCPFPVCKYDTSRGAISIRNLARDQQIRVMHQTTRSGLIAKAFGVSTRTVERVIARG